MPTSLEENASDFRTGRPASRSSEPEPWVGLQPSLIHQERELIEAALTETRGRIFRVRMELPGGWEFRGDDDQIVPIGASSMLPAKLAYAGGTAIPFNANAAYYDSYIASSMKMAKAAADHGTTEFLSNHSEFDDAFFKAHTAGAGRGARQIRSMLEQTASHAISEWSSTAPRLRSFER